MFYFSLLIYPIERFPDFPDDVRCGYNGELYKRLLTFQQDFEDEHSFHVYDFFEFVQKDFIFHKVHNYCNKDVETFSSVSETICCKQYGSSDLSR